jgi:hypothetical protein
MLAACGEGVPAAARTAPDSSAAPVIPAALALTVDATPGRWEARAAGDSAIRLLVTPRGDDRMTARLCGHLVTRSIAAVAIPFGLPIDTTMPPLAVRWSLAIA